MRKQDYETLARAISDEIKSADTWLVNTAVHVDEQNVSIARSRRNTAERLARYLADNLHVNRAAFLTACGVKP